MRSLFEELKRRNVFRVAAAYVVAAWLIVEVASLVAEVFDAPSWAPQLLMVLLLVGFPIALLFSWAFEITPEGIQRDDGISSESAGVRRTGRRLDQITIVLLLFAIGLLIYNSGLIVDNRPGGQAQQGSRAADSSERTSVAVLPFANMSGDPSQEYFSDGMTEEIIGKLAKVRGLRVISRTTVEQFKDSPLDVPSIASKLRVGYVLEGSVRKAGDRIRVTAQLVDADDDSHLWADNFDARLDDVFEVQETIARDIVKALGVHLSDSDTNALTRKPTDNVAAYEAYLRGQAFVEHWSAREMLEASRQFFRTALELDPDYALALAGLASVEAQTYRNFDSDPTRLDRADQLLDQAQAIDPDLVRAVIARGEVMAMRYDYKDASEQFRSALKLDAENYFAWDLLCWSLGYETPPRAKEAEAACREGLKLAPRYGEFYYHLARALVAQKRFEEAREAIAQLEAIWPNNSLIQLGWFWIEMGKGDYRKALGHLDESGAATSLTLSARAAAHSALNETDSAMAALDEAMAAGFRDTAWLQSSEYFESIRSSPEFELLLARHGLSAGH